MHIVLLKFRVVFEHIRNQSVYVLTNIVDLLIYVEHSPIVWTDILIFGQLLLLIWLVIGLSACHSYGFRSNFNMEIY